MTTLRILARCRRSARRCLPGSLWCCAVAGVCAYSAVYTTIAVAITGAVFVTSAGVAGVCALLSGE